MEGRFSEEEKMEGRNEAYLKSQMTFTLQIRFRMKILLMAVKKIHIPGLNGTQSLCISFTLYYIESDSRTEPTW